jgi:LmbE family N-acetylglucosaminyl deacetylase
MHIFLDLDSEANWTGCFPEHVKAPPVKEFFQGKNIYVISPHPDDTAVGCGAFIAALSKRNRTHSIVLTSGSHAAKPEVRQEETILEAKILGMEKPVFLNLPFYEWERQPSRLDEELLAAVLEPLPDVIFLPSNHDSHKTHKIARKLTLRILGQLLKSKYNDKDNLELISYETPWGLFPHGKYNAIFPIGEVTMRRKLEAIRVHKSQIERTQFVSFAKSLAQLRAAVVPEQALKKWGFGQKPLELGKYLEVYFSFQLKSQIPNSKI